MTSTKINAFRNAFSSLGLKFVSLQWICILVLTLLSMAWLQIPDSHVWQFVLAIIIALALVGSFLSFVAESFRWIRKPEAASQLWLRALWVLFFLALWFLLRQMIGYGRDHEELYAGFWNSKLSPHMRVLFSYPRLIVLQDRFYDLLLWLLSALVLPWAVELGGVGSRTGLTKRVFRAYKQWPYWMTTLVASIVGLYSTNLLIGWLPGKGVTSEIVSVVFRLGLAYTIDILFWCFILALVCSCLAESKTAAELKQ